MNFYEKYLEFKDFDFEKFFDLATNSLILEAINDSGLSTDQLLYLLSPKASNFIEKMAQKAHTLSLSHFGRAIILYTPLYLSNHCDNQCLYCGFNVENKIQRSKLTLNQIEKEAEFISKWGLQQILVLTGESKSATPFPYIKQAIEILKEYFASISIEIYPLSQNEYKELITLGIDGLTIYQETYDQKTYKKLHPKGPKSNYQFRLNTPERAALEKIRTINIGALLGLASWRKEVFFTILHAQYLQDKFPNCEISISVPRLRPQVSNFNYSHDINDKDIVQIITAIRIFLPQAGINLSTRENNTLRDNLIPLGITKISAGSSTAVGGHTLDQKSLSQFEIADRRDINQIKSMLLNKGYQPVLKDWVGTKLL